jgi:hypothetical protein
MATLDSTFDRIVVVNLRRRPDRRAEFLSDSPPANYQWFEGVDGSRVPSPLHWKSGEGAWGCMQSHRQILERAILDGVEKLLVLEDDAKFDGRFAERFASFMAAVPDHWDGLMLGGQNMSTPIPVSDGITRSVNCQRTHAYAVRGRYLRELYRVWVSGAGHCDHLMGPMHGEWKVYQPDPFLIAQRAGVSDITCREEGHRVWSKGAPCSRLLVTACAEKSRVERLIRQGAHIGYWRDSKTGLDRGLMAAYSGDEKKFRAEIAKWWEFVRFEAGAIDRGVPILWHPDAIAKYDWLVRANLGVRLVKVELTGSDVLEKLLETAP